MFRLNAGPGGVPLAGASFLPMIQPISAALSLQDSVTGTRSADSIVTQLQHDKITRIIQWLFQRSPWVMWGGVVAGRWSSPSSSCAGSGPAGGEVGPGSGPGSRDVKFAMVAGVVVLLLMAAGVWATQGYHFVETDKRFCNGCHIFVPSGQALDPARHRLLHRRAHAGGQARQHQLPYLPPAQSDEGSGQAGVLDVGSARQGDPAPRQGAAEDLRELPRAGCRQGDLAGHRGHRRATGPTSSPIPRRSRARWSASPATPGRRTASCRPTRPACQQGCHLTDKTKIKLGKMAGQADLHCIVCHKFTATGAAARHPGLRGRAHCGPASSSASRATR